MFPTRTVERKFNRAIASAKAAVEEAVRAIDAASPSSCKTSLLETVLATVAFLEADQELERGRVLPDIEGVHLYRLIVARTDARDKLDRALKNCACAGVTELALAGLQDVVRAAFNFEQCLDRLHKSIAKPN